MRKLHNEVLVSYDIEDNKNRYRLFRRLKEVGLVPIQKSVFWGHVNTAEEASVVRMLCEYSEVGDKAFIVRVKLSTQIAERNSIGYHPQDFPREPPRYHVL